MKKLLVFILAFSMASIVSAAPVLSINGSTTVDEITLDAPSGYLTIDIHIDIGLIGGTLDIILSNAQGSLDPTNMITNPNYSLMGLLDQPWDFAWVENVGSTPQSVSIGGGNFQTANGDVRWLMDNLVFHCEEDTDVIIQLFAGAGGVDYDEGGGYVDIPVGTLIDSVIVHQVPEPMTIALLGLGGLFLRRRK